MFLVPVEDMAPVMTGMGLKPKAVEAYQNLYNAIHVGRCELKDRPFLTRHGQTTLEQFAADAVRAFSAS